MIKFDKSREGYEVIKKKQYDTLEKLTVAFYNNNIPIDLSAYTIRLECLKTDNTIVIQENNISVKNVNEAEVLLNPQITIISGEVKCQFVLIKNGLQDTTFTFFINVEANIIKDGVASDSVITILDTLIDKIQEAGVINTNLDISITNGDTAKMRADINKNTADNIKTNEQLADIMYNINNSKLQIPELNDYARIARAISYLSDGDTLYFPNGSYDLGGNDINVTKAINIIGQMQPIYDWITQTLKVGTVLNNGGLLIDYKNVTVKNIGIDAPLLDNAIEIGSFGSAINIEIDKVSLVSQGHCCLIQSNKYSVSNIRVSSSYAYRAIHGFVSKSPNVTFANCYSSDCTLNGFVNVSDNMPSALQKGNALYNTLINCFANNCPIGFNAYSRDAFSDNNSNSILLSNLTYNNCRANNASICGFALGDTVASPIGNTHNDVKNITLVGCGTVGSTLKSIRFGKCDGVSINGFDLSALTDFSSGFAKNITASGINSTFIDGNLEPYIIRPQKSKGTTQVNLTITGDMPLSSGSVFDISGTGTTTNKITFTGISKSEIITLIIRSTGGGFVFGGFDTNNFVVPTDLTNTITWNNAQISQWTFMNSINKWVCVASRISPYS